MIDTKALRSKVLDLAIQGKLTEQLESDGTAEELFAQIQEEKQKLIKEGKIKKEKPLPPVAEEEIPFEIPSSWKWVHMGELFQHNTGKALNSSNTDGKMLEYITTSNVYWNKFDLTVIKQMPFTESEIEKCTITKGDLLICEGGDIGRSAIWNFDYDMRIQNHLHRLRAYLPDISNKFYYFIMKLYKEIGLIDGRGIGLQGFSSTRVHNLVIPLPPLAEQKRIVERVEEIFKLLDIIDEAQAKYSADAETLKSKLITMGIQGKLTEQLESDGTAEELFAQIQEEKQRLIKEGKIKKEKPLPPVADEEIPFEIPRGWKWCRLDDISEKIWAGRDKPDDFVTTKDETRTVPVVANGVTNEGILGYTSEATAPANTITVAGRGTIGFVVFRQYDYCPIVRLIVIEQSKIIYAKFLQYFLKILPESSVGSSTPQLTVPMIKPKPVPLPPLAEQKRISDRLDEILRVIG